MTDKFKSKPAIFVSHRQDDDFLRLLRVNLPECNVRILEWENTAGVMLNDEVTTEISKADVVVVVLTRAASLSPWVNQEIGYAMGLEKPIVPVVADNIDSKALLDGRKYQPYFADNPGLTAEQTAERVRVLLREAFTLTFTTFHEYQSWWAKLDESVYTDEACYWATPHDTWSWIMAHADKSGYRWYKTLIRGGTQFDRNTINIHYRGEDAVCGVGALSPDREQAVIGALSIDVTWDPGHWRRLDELLEGAPSAEVLLRWYKEESRRKTKIVVEMNLNEETAAHKRATLEALYVSAREAGGR